MYNVDNDGTRTPVKVCSIGSGSLYAYGVLDSGYKFDMKDEEAYELGRRAVYHATHRDSASGGIIRGMSVFYSLSFSLLINMFVFFFSLPHQGDWLGEDF